METDLGYLEEWRLQVTSLDLKAALGNAIREITALRAETPGFVAGGVYMTVGGWEARVRDLHHTHGPHRSSPMVVEHRAADPRKPRQIRMHDPEGVCISSYDGSAVQYADRDEAVMGFDLVPGAPIRIEPEQPDPEPGSFEFARRIVGNGWSYVRRRSWNTETQVCREITDDMLIGEVVGTGVTWRRVVSDEDKAATDWECQSFGIWHSCGIKTLFNHPYPEPPAPENSEPTIEERVAKLESILADIERERHGGSETPLTKV